MGLIQGLDVKHLTRISEKAKKLGISPRKNQFWEMGYMKNNRSYRTTKTGVRIPNRKIKWMTPPERTKSKSSDKDLEIPIATPKNFNRLFNSNFDALMWCGDTSENDEFFTAEDWEENNHDNS